MKQVVLFAIVVVIAFAGMVVFRETGRRDASSNHVRLSTPQMLQQVATISTGEEVEINAHLDASKWTVVEFKADW